MSAGHPATSQVRRTAAAAPARPTQPAPVRSTAQFAFAAASADDEIRLNLSDIPLMRLQDSMHVEGFKPSLLSRLLDLILPLKR
jgi:hypothetical protein